MGKTAGNAMTLEDVRLSAPARTSVKKEAKRLRELDINTMSDGQIIWHLVKKHKFGLVCTAFGIYLAFSLFGTLIVGLFESFVR